MTSGALMTIDHPGFADPVLDAQRAFRALLDAMARPGTLHRVAAPADAPAPLARATAAALLTLLDPDTQLWVEDQFRPSLEWIAFHTGATTTEHLAAAPFVVATTLPDLATLNAGTDAAPEDSTTLLLQLPQIGSGGAPRWRIEGPGIAAPRLIAADGLPPDFAMRWAANTALFPRGIDLVLCAGDALLALPRTTRVTEI